MASLDPLVSPSAPLEPERLARFSRQLSLPGFDEVAQRRLANARVLVIGAGGLGSATVPYLASAGVGTIGIIDTDVVELSNLHRQIVHGVADIGRSKLDSIAESVAAIDPTTKVICYGKHLDSSNILGILADYDVLLDGSDNFPTRYLANDAAVLSGKPLVWGAILRYSGQVSVSWAEHGPTYRDLFPAPPPPGSIPSCAEGGVLPSVCAVIGALMSAETIKIITGIGEPLIGTVTLYDALTGRFRELAYGRSDEVAPITELIDYKLFCGMSDKAKVESDLVPLGRNLTSHELAQLIAAGGELQLVDIRESYERAIAAIEPSDFLPLGSLMQHLDTIRRDAPVVLYCHSGGRSAHALRLLQDAGFDNVSHLAGGIDDYSVKIDTNLVRY